MDNLNQDETLLARWLAGELQEGDLEALRNLEGYPEYVEMLEALEGMSMPDFSPTLSWQALKEKRAVVNPQSSVPQALEENEQTEENPEEVGINQGEAIETKISVPQIIENQPIAEPAELPITDRQSPVVRRLIPWKMIAAIAAAIALLIVAIWWVSDGFGPPPMAETKAGEQKEVKLPDGSSVTLNALSSLSYSSEDWSNGRKVSLEGEAYFKAKKGKTFTVSTEQGSVEVVGTVFNVYARDNELEVKCSEGKVQVLNPDASERALLKAGEQISVINGRMQKRQGLEFQPKWFKGESTFRSEPLEKVLDEVERQFGVVVMADSIEGRSYTGKFVHKDLNQALKMVCVPMKLKYSVSNDTVFIK